MEVLYAAAGGGFVEVRIFDTALIDLVRGLRSAEFRRLGKDSDQANARNEHIRELANALEAHAYASHLLQTPASEDRSLAAFRQQYELAPSMDGADLLPLAR